MKTKGFPRFMKPSPFHRLTTFGLWRIIGIKYGIDDMDNAVGADIIGYRDFGRTIAAGVQDYIRTNQINCNIFCIQHGHAAAGGGNGICGKYLRYHSTI